MPSKKILISVLAVAVLAIVAVFAVRVAAPEDGWKCVDGAWVRYGNPSEPAPATGCGDGKPGTDEPGETAYEGNITFLTPTTMKIEIYPGHNETIGISGDTQFFDTNGVIKTYSSLMLGFKVRLVAVKAGDVKTAKEIRIIGEPNIIVYSPKAGDEVGLPLNINGSARVFENTFSYRIKDADGTLLLERNSMTSAPDAGIFGAFDIYANYPQPNGASGTVEVFEYSAKDGSETNKVVVPVVFKAVDSMDVKAYFPNTKKDPNMMDCSNVYPVIRRVPKSSATAMAALTELLAGPDRTEGEQGYMTSINSGVAIQKLTIQNGIAKVDFSRMLELGVGGSCRVTSITSQILQTLKQFPTVKSVVISIDGRTEDILQP